LDFNDIIGRMLTWDDSYAIALGLKQEHPGVSIEDVSLEMIYQWTLVLPDFVDEPGLVNEEILNAIVQEWLEEDGT
jgi:FeS assembly protein IscX